MDLLFGLKSNTYWLVVHQKAVHFISWKVALVNEWAWYNSHFHQGLNFAFQIHQTCAILSTLFYSTTSNSRLDNQNKSAFRGPAHIQVLPCFCSDPISFGFFVKDINPHRRWSDDLNLLEIVLSQNAARTRQRVVQKALEVVLDDPNLYHYQCITKARKNNAGWTEVNHYLKFVVTIVRIERGSGLRS